MPYDGYLPMLFDGEEMSMGLRLWTHGYDLYAPAVSTAARSGAGFGIGVIGRALYEFGLGSMFAAVAAGVYSTIEDAQTYMTPTFKKTYQPNPDTTRIYSDSYYRYCELAKTVESGNW
mgnify:CR=1 FL=1